MSQAILEPQSPSLVTGPRLNRWLIWKEMRLLLPLAISVVLMTIFLAIAQLLAANDRSDAARIELSLLLIPGLFATGAGLVLVGYERDQGTLDWLISLPPSPRQLILTKMALAAVILAVMWVIAMIGVEALGTSTHKLSRWRLVDFGGNFNGMTPVAYPLWMAHSLFILAASFYVSWRIRSQFQAILALMVLSCLPMVASEMIPWWKMSRPSGWSLWNFEQIGWFVCSLALTPLVGAMAYRRAIKAFSPQSVPRRLPRVTLRLETSAATVPLFGSQVAPLVWQSVQSARLLLLLLSTMILIGALRLVLAVVEASDEESLIFALGNSLPVLLAVSWLGVSVFKNDGGVSKIQFLADRGISPTKVFAARHAVPLAIVSVAVILYTLLASRAIIRHDDVGTFGLPSMFMVWIVLMIVYSVSQWTSQQIRTLTLSVILAPVCSALVLNWFQLTYFRWHAPLWTIIVGIALPMLAAWWMMARYMDARDRPLSIVCSIAMVGMMIFLPLWSSQPTFTAQAMPGDLRLRLQAEGDKALRLAPPAVSLTIARFTGDRKQGEKLSIQQSMQLLRTRSEKPEEFIVPFDTLQQDPRSAASIQVARWANLHQRLMYERVRFEQAAESADDLPQKNGAVAEFANWLDAASIVSQSLRRSVRWGDQEIADRLEIWLVDTLTSDALQPYRTTEFFRGAASRLPDESIRNAARRKAILATRSKYSQTATTKRSLTGLGGIQVVDPSSARLDTIVLTALDASGTTEIGSNQPSWQHRMHHLLLDPSVVPLELGPYGNRARKLPAMMTMLSSPAFGGVRLYPAQFWGMPWEKKANELRRQAEQAIDTSKTQSEVSR